MIYEFGKNKNQGIEMSTGCENSSHDVKSKFLNSIVDLVSKALDINHNEQRNFKTLLTKVLKKDVNSHSDVGLLQQYEAYILELAIQRFHDTLKIPKDIGVNHGNANHAKYSDLVKYIESNFQKIEQSKEEPDAE